MQFYNCVMFLSITTTVTDFIDRRYLVSTVMPIRIGWWCDFCSCDCTANVVTFCCLK